MSGCPSRWLWQKNLHHSRQKVEGGAREGLRAQMTARATCARPGVFKEPEPQGGAVTDGYVAADAAGEAVDARTLSFLLARSIAETKKVEEEEEEEAGGEGGTPLSDGSAAGASHGPSGQEDH